MGLRRSVRLAVLCAACSSFAVNSYGQDAFTPPAHPITREQVQQLVEVTHMADRMKKSLHKMDQQQKRVTPYVYFPDAFWTDFEAEFEKLDWVALSTSVYQKYLSEEDATKAIAFYNTEAGQRALSAGMAVTDEMMQVGAEQGKMIGAKLGEKYQKEFQENMRKAQQQSSSAASK